jgi:two-component system CheB/CheR fusion protein
MVTSVKPDQETSFIVGIGASAGDMQALEAFCNSLPDNPNGAFVVVQHLSPNHRSMMTEILQRQTALPVQEVQNQIWLEPAHVYVLPPGKTLFLEAQRLRLEASSESPRYPTVYTQVESEIVSTHEQWLQTRANREPRS